MLRRGDHVRRSKISRLSAWGLMLCGLLSGCATLPDVNEVAAGTPTAPVRFETARGVVSPTKSSTILSELKSDVGNIDILQKHLALEQSINPENPLVLGNKLVLLQDGPATYEAMFAAIRSAENHINLETYIFEDGEVGNAFAELLLEKRAKGVQVNVIYDSVGSLTTPRAFFERLSRAGIQVLEFNPVNPLKANPKTWAINNRDHRKLLIVDGRIAFLGGINISESYSSGSLRSSSRASASAGLGWRDTHLQIEGPVVADFQKLFLDTWVRQKGPTLSDRTFYPKLVPQGDEIVRAIGSTADTPINPIYLTLLSAINHAEQKVQLTNAYFVPDPQLIEALTGAAQRGVDVQFILPSKTDSWVVFHAGRSHYDTLLKAGVQIYERRDAVLHSKTASIDGVWSTIGSTNLDWRSFLHNDELNAVILGRDFAKQMEGMFDKDRAASNPIVYKQWKRRSVLLRFKEWFSRLPEYWL